MGRLLQGIFYDRTRTKFQLGNECYQAEGRVTGWAVGRAFIKHLPTFPRQGTLFSGAYTPAETAYVLPV